MVFKGILRTVSINLRHTPHSCHKQKATSQTNYMSAAGTKTHTGRGDSIRWMTKWNNREGTNCTVSAAASQKHPEGRSVAPPHAAPLALPSWAPPLAGAPHSCSSEWWDERAVRRQRRTHLFARRYDLAPFFFKIIVLKGWPHQFKTSFMSIILKR